MHEPAAQISRKKNAPIPLPAPRARAPQDDTFTSSDPSVFRAVSGDLAISANVRTASGWLFPLPGALLFLGKPARFVRHEDVIGAEFARVGVSSTFDLTLNLAGGGQLEFGQIDQGELPRIQAYVAERRLPVGAWGEGAPIWRRSPGQGERRWPLDSASCSGPLRPVARSRIPPAAALPLTAGASCVPCHATPGGPAGPERSQQAGGRQAAGQRRRGRL